MASVIPIILAVLLLSGIVAALWQLWSARPSAARLPTTDEGALRIRALTKLGWAMFLLFHGVFLLVLSESREVPQTLSICASAGGALTFLSGFIALLSCISLERQASAKR